jgi:uncharacterized membrane protein
MGQPNAPRQGIAEFVTSLLGCGAFIFVLWGFSKLLPGTLLRRNWDDASMAELWVDGAIFLFVLICALIGWFLGELAAVILLKRFVSRETLRVVFVRGGLIARWEARTFDTIFPKDT